MPNAVVMTGYGPPEVLKWAAVPLPEPGQGQIRIKVKAAGISPTDLAMRAGYLKDIPLPPDAVLGFEAAGTVDAVGPGVTGTSAGDGVTALLFSLGGYAEYAVASIWTRMPESVSWIDAAALPSSAEAAAGVLRQLDVKSGETLLLFGGGGSVGIIATQLAVARGIKVISAVGEHDEALCFLMNIHAGNPRNTLRVDGFRAGGCLVESLIELPLQAIHERPGLVANQCHRAS